jgi:hypothetical protein
VSRDDRRGRFCALGKPALFIRKQDSTGGRPRKTKLQTSASFDRGRCEWLPMAALGWPAGIASHFNRAAASHRRVTACRACSLNCHCRWASKTRQWSVDAVGGKHSRVRFNGWATSRTSLAGVNLVRNKRRPCEVCGPVFPVHTQELYAGSGTEKPPPRAMNGDPIRGLLFKHAFKHHIADVRRAHRRSILQRWE